MMDKLHFQPLRTSIQVLTVVGLACCALAEDAAHAPPPFVPPSVPVPARTNTPTASSNKSSINVVIDALRDTESHLASTNLLATVHQGRLPVMKELEHQLANARQQHRMRLTQSAVPNFITILKHPDATDAMKRVALMELGLIAQEENDLPKAQQIFAQYISRWPDDPSVPEIILRQGLVFRQMGSSRTALSKFYAVMTSALILKTTQFDYYQRLVLQAQTEIAETHYQLGQHQEAVDFLSRLLKMEDTTLNRAQLHYKLLRSLSSLGRDPDVISRAKEFLAKYPDSPEQPEVRFLCASAYKQRGMNADALEQVLLLLQEQRVKTINQPATWAYWQQRTGNEIANQLYREGDYARAIDIYANLAQIDSSPAWQLPVYYQIAMSYERLEQPMKAVETYESIIGREKEIATNSTPSLKAVVQMARWRRDHLNWHTKAEANVRELKTPPRDPTPLVPPADPMNSAKPPTSSLPSATTNQAVSASPPPSVPAPSPVLAPPPVAAGTLAGALREEPSLRPLPLPTEQLRVAETAPPAAPNPVH